MDLLETLNPKQKEAVLATEGPTLVIAGAGSGKTKVLTHRIAYLISQGVSADSILAVTFTNKAAHEMKERVARLLADNAGQMESETNNHMPWVGTFHALGVYILRRDGEAIGVKRNFTILDEDEAVGIIKRALKKFELDPKQYQPARIRALISKLKNAERDLESFLEKNTEEDEYPKALVTVMREYGKELEASNSLDFDDLLVKTVGLLSKQPVVLEKYRARWQYIVIDEYQDTNAVQYKLTNLLARGAGNIMVVGDVDQAIYSWRGADFRNILNFEKDWPNTRVITLEQNYRSTKVILEAANMVIEKNVERKEKNLWTDRTKGELITLSLSLN